MTMAKALLKTGETIELPFDEMVDFVVRNPDLIQEQQFEKTLPPRRSKRKTAQTLTSQQ